MFFISVLQEATVQPFETLNITVLNLNAQIRKKIPQRNTFRDTGKNFFFFQRLSLQISSLVLFFTCFLFPQQQRRLRVCEDRTELLNSITHYCENGKAKQAFCYYFLCHRNQDNNVSCNVAFSKPFKISESTVTSPTPLSVLLGFRGCLDLRIGLFTQMFVTQCLSLTAVF